MRSSALTVLYLSRTSTYLISIFRAVKFHPSHKLSTNRDGVLVRDSTYEVSTNRCNAGRMFYTELFESPDENEKDIANWKDDNA